MSAAASYEEIMADDRLPSPGPVASELLALTRQPEAAVEDIARLIAMDPAICSRVMRAVNAPAAGLRRQIASVDQAVTILGLRSVARLAIEVSVLERSRSGLAEFDYGTFWSESLARAVAARILAQHTKHAHADEAFTYGLLARIGRLALVSVYPQAYRDLLLTLGRVDPTELAEAEAAVFETDAEALSALMMRAWGMPAYHDAMSAAGAGDTAAMRREAALLRICRAASLAAQVLVHTNVRRDQIAAAIQAMAAIGIGAEAVSNLFPDIIATLHETGAQLQIQTHTVASLAEAYAHAIDLPRPTSARLA